MDATEYVKISNTYTVNELAATKLGNIVQLRFDLNGPVSIGQTNIGTTTGKVKYTSHGAGRVLVQTLFPADIQLVGNGGQVRVFSTPQSAGNGGISGSVWLFVDD